MREIFGPGWRRHYARRGDALIVMLGGGTKGDGLPLQPPTVAKTCHQAFIDRTPARIPCSLMELRQGVMLGFDVPSLVARASELSPRT